MRMIELTMPGDDDIDDICKEFGVEPGLVEVMWLAMQKVGGKTPNGDFIPRNRREMALACRIALDFAERSQDA